MKLARTPSRRTSQRGVMLLEALIAVVIFSIGILAVVALQSVAIRETTQAKMRSDASYLADKVLGDLGSLNLATGALAGSTLLTDFNGDYTATTLPAAADPAMSAPWQQYLLQTLPEGRLTLTVTLVADPIPITGAVARNIPEATLRVRWRLPINDALGSPQTATFSQSARLVN